MSEMECQLGYGRHENGNESANENGAVNGDGDN